MKQVFQDLKSGETLVAEVPAPSLPERSVKIETQLSLVSAGTERMIVDFAKSSYLSKAKKQPEKVRQVIDKVKTDGLIATYETISARLDELQPLGYSNVGTVIEVGKKISNFAVGDRVISNGRHSEVVVVPENLVTKIPDSVSNSDATFTVVSSIALQGIRLIEPTLGETVVVFGLGLIGLAACQILLANGCAVIGFDNNSARVEKAREFGVDSYDSSSSDPIDVVNTMTQGIGADAVLITASAKGDTLVSLSAKMSRKRGRIVLVGVCNLDLNRSDFYEKELSFQVSCSYGPGRYDPEYEEHGNDYPVGFVRWTENRNFSAILNLIKDGKLRFDGLVDSCVDLDEAADLYDKILSGAVLTGQIKYKASPQLDKTVYTRKEGAQKSNVGESGSEAIIGVVGAGNYTKARILPTLDQIEKTPFAIASKSGVTSTSAARKYGIDENTTDLNTVFGNEKINTVFVTTRHNSHANLVLKSLQNKKHVYVEKPLCLNLEELREIVQEWKLNDTDVAVGFNRRFAPSVLTLKKYLDTSERGVSINYTVNAGKIDREHWTQDEKVGGGRIVGEACHFIDLCQYLAGSKIVQISAMASSESLMGDGGMSDVAIISLKMENGSIANINYFSNGSKQYSKERIEVFHSGSVSVVDNYTSLKSFGRGPNEKSGVILKKQDKGHKNSICSFITSIENNGKGHIPFDQSVNSMAATLLAIESLESNKMMDVPEEFINI